MSEEKKTVEVVCVLTTLDEEVYQAGKTYLVAEDLLALYPHSFKPAGWVDPTIAESAAAEKVREDIAQRTQLSYENARDHQVLMESASEIERARQRKELEDQIRRQREENRKADLAGVETTGWQPTPPAPQDPVEAKTAPARKSSGPAHTLPRAERLKHAQ